MQSDVDLEEGLLSNVSQANANTSGFTFRCNDFQKLEPRGQDWSSIDRLLVPGDKDEDFDLDYGESLLHGLLLDEDLEEELTTYAKVKA